MNPKALLVLAAATLAGLAACSAVPDLRQIDAFNPPPAGYAWTKDAAGLYTLQRRTVCLDTERLAPQARTSAASLARLEQLARAGDAQAAYLVGHIEAMHAGTGSSLAAQRRALAWYRLGEAEGGARATLAALLAYATGQGHPIDPRRAGFALTRLEFLARHDNVRAENDLAALYQSGSLGAPKRPREALAWWRRAAGQGSQMAMLRLHAIRLAGEPGVVAADAGRASYWLHRAQRAQRTCEAAMPAQRVASSLPSHSHRPGASP